MKHIVICLSVILLLFTGCKAPQDTTKAPSHVRTEVKKQYERILEKHKDWATFTAKASVSITNKPGSTISSSLQIQMIKDSIILISVRPFLGFEVARFQMTKDSVKVVEKMGKRCIAEALPTLGTIFPAGMSLTVAQDILINRIFLLGDNELNKNNFSSFGIKEKGDGSWWMSPIEQPAEFNYDFLLQDDRLMTTMVSSKNGNKQVLCNYEQFETSGNHVLPQWVYIKTNGFSSTPSLSLRYDIPSVSWNKNVKNEFPDISRYSQVSIDMLLKMLAK